MSWQGAYLPLSPELLAESLADCLASGPGTRRVAVDGALCARPHILAASLIEPLRARGRPVGHIRAELFWRDASLRFEYGRQDQASYLNWLDSDALRREVLDPVLASGRFLPSLRDPQTNRATRAAMQDAPPGMIVIVSGAAILGRGLPFDLTVHAAMSAAALARRTPAEDAWLLPAIQRYRDEVRPEEVADIVVRLDDPARPAVRGLSERGESDACERTNVVGLCRRSRAQRGDDGRPM